MFKLPNLPYAYNALEPYIDEQTMTIHHTKHHQAYVNGANEVISDKTNEDLLSILSNPSNLNNQKLINMLGGHYNHSLFWQMLSPKIDQKPEGKLLDAITSTFGSLEKFQEQFTQKAMSVFGSGWAFLIQTPDGKLSLKRHSFQNSPVMYGNKPLLALDVWEHAYYLKYQNRRAEYIQAFWKIVNWEFVSDLFNKSA